VVVVVVDEELFWFCRAQLAWTYRNKTKEVGTDRESVKNPPNLYLRHTHFSKPLLKLCSLSCRNRVILSPRYPSVTCD
jgi:hypothetical protein